jgi:hypothetical protein
MSARFFRYFCCAWEIACRESRWRYDVHGPYFFLLVVAGAGAGMWLMGFGGARICVVVVLYVCGFRKLRVCLLVWVLDEVFFWEYLDYGVGGMGFCGSRICVLVILYMRGN